MGDVFVENNSIAVRTAKLNNIFMSKSSKIQHRAIVGREGLLDSLLVLYQECHNEKLMRNKHIANFVNTYEETIREIQKLRIGINDFEIKKIIGRGHFGEVQVVRERYTGDVYAMKTLRKTETLNQQHVAFYEEERDIMAKASSPWITQLQYAFQDHRHLYLVMEFHPGGDLLSLLSRYDDILEESMARFYLGEIVLSIRSLHTMGYVHRDIKPDNILIDRTGHVKLADFGSAAKIDGDGRVKSRMAVGTPDYISPELLISMNDEACTGSYGVEVDWWSLGIMAYEMLYGTTPFTDDEGSMMATYSNIMNYKKCLVFPKDEVTVSQRSQAFIKGLLTEKDERLDYEAICKHNFFEDVNFVTIRQETPPFIPTITSQDDTSNFDEFEVQKPEVRLDLFLSKEDFSGRDLPFIGFTYTKMLQNNIRSSDSRSSLLLSDGCSPKAKNTLERKLTCRTQELLSIKEKYHHLESKETRMKNTYDSLEKRLKEKDEKLLRVSTERDCIEKDLVGYLTEINSLKRNLDLEKHARFDTDKKAEQLVKDIQEQAELAENLRHDLHRAEVNEYKDNATRLENELEHIRKKMERLDQENKLKDDNTNGYERNILELQQKLDKAVSSNQRKSCETENKLLRQFESYEQKEIQLNHQLNQVLDENKALTKKFNEVNGKFTAYKEEVCSRDIEIAGENLEQKLKESEEKRRSLEMRVSELRKIEGIESRVADKMHVQAKRINELAEKNFGLDDELRRKDIHLRKLERVNSQKESHLQDTIHGLELKSKNKTKDTTELENQVKVLKEEKEKMTRKVADLESIICELECTVKIDKRKLLNLEEATNTLKVNEKAVIESRKLEEELSDAQQEKIYMESKMTRLGDLLVKAKEERDSNMKIVNELEDNLKDLKLSHECEANSMKNKLNQAEIKISELSAAMTDSDLKENELKKKICLLESEISKASRQMEIKITKIELEKRELEVKHDSLMASSAMNERSQYNLSKVTEHNNLLSEKAKKLELELQTTNNQHQKLHGELKLMQSQQSQKQKKCEQLEEKIRDLQRFKCDQNTQLSEQQRKSIQFEEKQALWNKEKQTYEKANEELEEHINDLYRKYTAEKQNRETAENKVKCLSLQFEGCKAKLDAVNSQLSEKTELSLNLGCQLDVLEKQHSLVEVNMKSMQRNLAECLEDNNLAMDENGKLSKQIKSLQATIFTLTQDLENATENYDTLQTDKLELENYMEGIQVSYDQEKFKYDSTINQQTKLIDFLQAKTEIVKKKKNIFGTPAKSSKSVAQPMTPGRPVQWRDMQNQLDMERGKNIDLQDQLIKVKTELHQVKSASLQIKGNHSQVCSSKCNNLPPISRSSGGMTVLAPTSHAFVSALVMSPSKQCSPRTILAPSRKRQASSTGSLTPRPNKERMHHNIPHRFTTGLNMRGTKCAVCLGSVHFVKHAAKCQECQVVCHTKCAPSLPATCGLPTQYVQHFSDVVLKKSSSPAKLLSTADLNSLEMRGWMRLPRTGKQSIGGWEKRWTVLEVDRLCFFDKNSTDSSPVDTFNLFPVDGEVLVNSAVTAAELRFTASSDLPYILKLESRPCASNWPGRILYLMATSFPEKQKWVAVLEAILSETQQASKTNCILGRNVLSLHDSKRLEINCSHVLTQEILLIGADEGLFAHQLSNESDELPIGIEGLKRVYFISSVESLGLVIVIAGENRNVYTLEIKTLLSRIEQGFIMQPVSILARKIENITGCTLLESQTFSDATYLCVATPLKICILKYNEGLSSFCIRKEIPTVEPCSCILFTSSGLLVGAEKLYRIDVFNYSITDFLDKQDSSLAYAVFGAANFESFPIAVYEISDEPEEFLICFHEFGVFVDGFGRRSREEDTKWNGLPISFAYRKPYIFVILFNSLQVIDVSNSVKSSRDNQASLDIPSPHYLGRAFTNGAVYVASTYANVIDVMCLQGNIGEYSDNNKENTRIQPPVHRKPSKSPSKRLGHASGSGVQQDLGPRVSLQYSPDSKKLKVNTNM